MAHCRDYTNLIVLHGCLIKIDWPGMNSFVKSHLSLYLESEPQEHAKKHTSQQGDPSKKTNIQSISSTQSSSVLQVASHTIATTRSPEVAIWLGCLKGCTDLV